MKPKVLIKDINEEAKKNIELFGFHIWYLTEKNSEMINCFTIGLEESYSHKNIQITLPLEKDKCANIIHALVDQIKSGKAISVNNIHDGLLNFSFLALDVDKSSQTMDFPVIRIIIPDSNGKFAHEEECDSHFKKQIL